MKITVSDHVTFQPDKLAKIALAATERFQLDLYCVGPSQAQKPHTHEAQDWGQLRVGSEARVARTHAVGIPCPSSVSGWPDATLSRGGGKADKNRGTMLRESRDRV